MDAVLSKTLRNLIFWAIEKELGLKVRSLNEKSAANIQDPVSPVGLAQAF